MTTEEADWLAASTSGVRPGRSEGGRSDGGGSDGGGSDGGSSAKSGEPSRDTEGQPAPPDGWNASIGTGAPGDLAGRWPWSIAPSAGGPGRRERLAGLWCLLGALLAGPVIGLVWAATSPRLDVAAVRAGSSAALDVQSTIDVCFGLTCAAFGVVAGLLAFWRWSDAGWPVPAGLAIGGLGGSLLAGRIGHELRSGSVLHRLPPEANQVIVGLVDVRVRAEGLYLVFPTVTLVVLAAAIWISQIRARGRNIPAPADD